MKPIDNFLFLLPLLLCFSFLPLLTNANEGTGTKLITEVCKDTTDKDFCVSTFESAPDIEQEDITGLTLIALKLASKNASDTSALIKKMLADTTLDPVIEQCLADCKDHYLDAAEQLDDSIAALLANAYSDVHAWVTTAITDANTCEDGFKQHPGKESVLSGRNSIVVQLCNNALAFNNRLAQK
ncbi:PMEI domain-containing protein [Cephalotus follicularis]|uniref:PMEI domain-containing protein n=1 Tax=Cephalotus follicularis TaxID=3775 RepID=A0A1Q3B489_CEPFO|nr:PMEI domain-containing protein [Cephalotus follicularis]